MKIDIGGFADNARRILVLPHDPIVMVGRGRNVSDNVEGVVVAPTPDGNPEKAPRFRSPMPPAGSGLRS